jgi:phage-related protein
LMLTYKRTAKLTGEQGVVSKLQGILWWNKQSSTDYTSYSPQLRQFAAQQQKSRKSPTIVQLKNIQGRAVGIVQAVEHLVGGYTSRKADELLFW